MLEYKYLPSIYLSLWGCLHLSVYLFSQCNDGGGCQCEALYVWMEREWENKKRKKITWLTEALLLNSHFPAGSLFHQLAEVFLRYTAKTQCWNPQGLLNINVHTKYRGKAGAWDKPLKEDHWYMIMTPCMSSFNNVGVN